MDSSLELNALLDSWLRWLRLCRSAVWAVRGLALGLAASLVMSLIALTNQAILPEEYLRLAIAFAGAGFVAGAVSAYLWPVARLESARFFDRRFRLRERVSTALELAEGVADIDLTEQAAELRQKQLEDALAAARVVDPRQSLPIRVGWQEILLILTLVAGSILGWTFGAPAFQAAQSARTLEKAIEAETARVEEIISQVEAEEPLTREQKEAITAPLEEAVQQLQEAETLEQAVSILTRAEGDLSALAEAQNPQLAQDLQEAGESLGQEGSGALESFGERLAGGETGAAAQTLADLDPGELSQAEQEALAGQLEQAAQTLSESHPELAGQLQAAASQIREGNPQAARDQLQEAAQTLAEAGEGAAQREMAGQAMEQLAESRGRLGQQAGAGGQGAEGAGQQPGSGGQREGQDTGQGQNQAQGSAGSGGGAGRGEGSSGAEAGAAAGTDPIGQGNGPGDGGERPYEAIYAPQRLGGEGGQEVALPGSDQPGEQVIGEGNTPLDEAGQSRVPYTEVFQSYAETYRQAIESGQVPVPFRDVVREYFSSLEP